MQCLVKSLFVFILFLFLFFFVGLFFSLFCPSFKKSFHMRCLLSDHQGIGDEHIYETISLLDFVFSPTRLIGQFLSYSIALSEILPAMVLTLFPLRELLKEKEKEPSPMFLIFQLLQILMIFRFPLHFFVISDHFLK